MPVSTLVALLALGACKPEPAPDRAPPAVLAAACSPLAAPDAGPGPTPSATASPTPDDPACPRRATPLPSPTPRRRAVTLSPVEGGGWSLPVRLGDFANAEAALLDTAFTGHLLLNATGAGAPAVGLCVAPAPSPTPVPALLAVLDDARVVGRTQALARVWVGDFALEGACLAVAEEASLAVFRGLPARAGVPLLDALGGGAWTLEVRGVPPSLLLGAGAPPPGAQVLPLQPDPLEAGRVLLEATLVSELGDRDRDGDPERASVTVLALLDTSAPYDVAAAENLLATLLPGDLGGTAPKLFLRLGASPSPTPAPSASAPGGLSIALTTDPRLPGTDGVTAVLGAALLERAAIGVDREAGLAWVLLSETPP